MEQLVDKPVVVIVVAIYVYEPAVSVAVEFELYGPMVTLPVPVGVAGAVDARLSVTPEIDQPASAILEGVEQYRALVTVILKSLNAILPSQTSDESG